MWIASCEPVQGEETYTVQMGQPPVPGTCVVTPSSGTVLIDQFSVVCDGFYDEDVPLQYLYYYNDGATTGLGEYVRWCGIHVLVWISYCTYIYMYMYYSSCDHTRHPRHSLKQNLCIHTVKIIGLFIRIVS